jgi:hypothetical protein
MGAAVRQRIISELDKRRVPLETGAMVAAIVAVKLVFDALSWEFIALSPLSTSILGGSIFVIGILVAACSPATRRANGCRRS